MNFTWGHLEKARLGQAVHSLTAKFDEWYSENPHPDVFWRVFQDVVDASVCESVFAVQSMTEDDCTLNSVPLQELGLHFGLPGVSSIAVIFHEWMRVPFVHGVQE